MRYDSTQILTEQERSAEFQRLLGFIPNEPPGERVRFVMRILNQTQKTVRIWSSSRPIPQAKLYVLGNEIKKQGWFPAE